MGISALKMLSDGTLQATRETERYQASLDSLKSLKICAWFCWISPAHALFKLSNDA
jgi:hypothetical protein